MPRSGSRTSKTRPKTCPVRLSHGPALARPKHVRKHASVRLSGSRGSRVQNTLKHASVRLSGSPGSRAVRSGARHFRKYASVRLTGSRGPAHAGSRAAHGLTRRSATCERVATLAWLDAKAAAKGSLACAQHALNLLICPLALRACSNKCARFGTVDRISRWQRRGGGFALASLITTTTNRD